MLLSIKQTALVSALLLSMTVASAGSDETIKICRTMAFNLDYLGRYQDRLTCSNHLEGATTYFACSYIATNRITEAKELLDIAIIKTQYALDLRCNDGGMKDGKPVFMADIIKQLQSIQKNL